MGMDFNQIYDKLENELEKLVGLDIKEARQIVKRELGAKYSAGPTLKDKENGTSWCTYEYYIDRVALFYIEYIGETRKVTDVGIKREFDGVSLEDMPLKDRFNENTRKNREVRLNESQLKKLIKEAVKNAMYNFASDKPQFDINSDEWNRNYDEMERDVRGKDKAMNDAMMDLQTRHHFGAKGKGNFEGDLPKQGKQYKKDIAMSPETVETEVMRALNDGKSPEEIMNLKPFSPKETEYIKDDCFDWLEPVGTIDKAGKIVFYDTRKNKFVSYDDDREY